MSVNVSYPTVGSWFPTGYYGHYRNRARSDFINENRYLAKPQPPQRFFHRSMQPATCHTFSLHDNRHSFQSDASYFAQGLGRKRHPERSGIFDPSILSWPAYRTNPNIDRPLTSTYRKDFRLEESNAQLLVHRPKTSFDGLPSTTYRIAHCNDSPNSHLINALNNEALIITSRSRSRQCKKKESNCRDTVASCLSWYRPHVPLATCHTNYNESSNMESTLRNDVYNNGCPTASTTLVAHESKNITSNAESCVPVLNASA